MQTLRGLIVALLLLINLLFLPSLAILIAGVRLITPIKKWRDGIDYFLHEMLPPAWWGTNNLIMDFFLKTHWNIQADANLNRKHWYFLISNHQSWLDILVLGKVFNARVPMLKFFIKQELLWALPIGGLAAYVMGFPFMRRYSKSYLKKHPEKIGQDLETTRKACLKFKNQPVTVINFLEGTRATPDKRKKLASPYQHLLPPRAGGLSFVINAMSGLMQEIIDVTIIYPPRKFNLWDFVCGRVEEIKIIYRLIPITPDLLGNYYEDQDFRVHFQHWLNQTWREKDQLISVEQNKML